MKNIRNSALERTVWSSDIDIREWVDYREDLKENGTVLNDDEFYDEVVKLNNEYLDEERAYLSKELGNTIICIADLGLWDGRKNGYKLLGNKISDCFYSDTVSNTWYINEDGDFCCRAAHHDGVNFYCYRVFKDDVTQNEIDSFCGKVCSGAVTDEDFARYTRSVGAEIAEIYGFDCPC